LGISSGQVQRLAAADAEMFGGMRRSIQPINFKGDQREPLNLAFHCCMSKVSTGVKIHVQSYGERYARGPHNLPVFLIQFFGHV
jgi:hypothetical protein